MVPAPFPLLVLARQVLGVLPGEQVDPLGRRIRTGRQRLRQPAHQIHAENALIPAGVCQPHDGRLGKRVVDDGVHEHERPDPLRLAQRQQLGHPAADVMPDNGDLVPPAVVEELGEKLRLHRQRRLKVWGGFVDSP